MPGCAPLAQKGVEPYCGVWVRSQVIEELFTFCHSVLRAVQLFACDGAEGHKYGEVDGPCVVKNAADNALDVFYFVVRKRRRGVWVDWTLRCTVVLFRLRVMGAVLWSSRGIVFVSLQLFYDISRH